jgi:TP901 family phage tail tape measure protein
MSTVETDVVLDINGTQVKQAMDDLAERVAAIGKLVKEVGLSGKKGIDGFNASLSQTLKTVTTQIGRLESFEKSMREQGRRPIRQLNEDQSFSASTRKASVYAQTLNNASSAAEGLQARLNQIDKSLTVTGDKGNLGRRSALSRRMGVEQAMADLKAVERQIQRTEELAGRTGGSFGPAQRRIEAARDNLQRQVLNPRVTNTDFQTELRELRAAQAAYQEAVREARQMRLQQIREDRRMTNVLEPASTSRVGVLQERRNIRADVAALESVKSAEAAREASNMRLDALFARHAAARGREKIDLEQDIRLENLRNGAIEQRLKLLGRQERMPASASSPKGPESKLGNIFSASYGVSALARTSVYGAAGLASFAAFNAISGSVSTMVEYEDKLKQLQAIANATDTQMVGLSKSIMEVGQSSRFSLVQLTEMATKLAQAGVSVAGMKNALKAVSTLAAASGSTPDEAVNLVTASLGAFQLQGTEAARVADLMTTALNRTRLTVQQAALAIQYVGATAYEQNITLEQLLSTTAAISQAGVKSGSTLGTGMRQFLVDLQKPSKDLTEQLERLKLTQADVDVTTRGLPAVLKTLSEAGFGAAQAYGNLETRAAAWYLVAKNNLPLMAELQLAMADQGAVALANERAMNSLSAQWQQLKNILAEGFQDSANNILMVVKNLIMQISDRLKEMRRYSEEYYSPERAVIRPWDGRAVQAKAEKSLEYLLNWASPKTTYANEGGLGTWLANLSRDSRDATGRMEELETAINQTTEKASEQAQTVSSLDKEILRLSTQEKSLVGDKKAVNAETVSLMTRFEGLSKYIVGTTGDVRGLIGALQQLRAEEAGQLVDDLGKQIGALQGRQLDAAKSRQDAVSKIRGNSALMGALTPKEIEALSGLTGPNGRAFADLLLRAADRLANVNTDWAKLLNSAGANQQTVFSTAGQRNVVEQQRWMADASRSKWGMQTNGTLSTVEGELARLRLLNGDARVTLRKSMETELSQLEGGLNRLLSSNTVKVGQRPFFQSAQAKIGELRQQILNAVMPSKEETKKLGRDAQPGANISAAEMARRLQEQFPGIVISSARQRMPGEKAYKAGSLHARPGGSAVDITKLPAGVTPDNVIAFIEAQGVTVPNTNNGFLDEFKHPSPHATGGHLHFGWEPKASQMSRRAEAAQAKAERAAEREKDRAEREVVARERFALGTADKVLNKSLRDLRYATTDELFAAGEDQAKAALKAWAEKLEETTQAELKRRDATPTEIKDRMDEVAARIEERRDEINTSIFDYLQKSIQKQLDAIELKFKERVAPYENGVALAQGRIEGLGYQSLQGKVPDFVQQMAERNAGYAQENLVRAQSGALGSQISDTRGLLVRSAIDLELRKGTLNSGQIEEAEKGMQALSLQIDELVTKKAQLDAALGAGGLLPTSVNEGLRQAIANYREVNGLNNTVQQDLMLNMTSGLAVGQEALTTFFSDTISGTRSVTQAFGDMARSVLKYIQQLAAKMIASRIFGMILSAVGGGFSNSAANSMVSSNMAALDTIGRFHGGQVKAFSGRYITDGVPSRDSVNARIAKGEYVVRKSAVDSLGVGFMDKLNEQGARALTGLAPKVVMPPKAEQKMNVYVVAPEHQPQMGPNDVLVTIANDIANNGQTKQLIKHVAQGG